MTDLPYVKAWPGGAHNLCVTLDRTVQWAA